MQARETLPVWQYLWYCLSDKVFFVHIVIHVTLSRVTLALLGSVFQTERFVESISKPSISFNLYCDCLAFLLKDEINFILLKIGTKFTQNWNEIYSKVERILLKSGTKFTQKWSGIYSKVDEILLDFINCLSLIKMVIFHLSADL